MTLVEELMSDIALLSERMDELRTAASTMAVRAEVSNELNNLFLDSLLRIARGGENPQLDAYDTLMGAKVICICESVK